MKIVDSYDLDNLIKDYGFKKNEEYNVYRYEIYESTETEINCDILVNTTEHNDRKIRFYYYDDNEGNKKELKDVYDDKGNYIRTCAINVDCVEFDIEIPEVLMKMIKDGIVE